MALMKKQKAWRTAAATAKYLGVDDATMQKLINHPGFPAYKLGNGPVIVLTKELDEYLASAGIMAAEQGKMIQLHQQ